MAKSTGASIQAVFECVRDLTNKDQHGFISDNEFNNFAEIAQLNIFNGLFDELKDANRLNRSGFNPNRDKSRTKRIQEDLSFFSTKATLTKTGGVFSFTSDSSSPSHMARLISIATAGSILLDQSTKKPIEICYDEEKIERILISNISAPTEEFPVALIADDIHVFPTSINKIQVRYYRQPGSRDANGVRSISPPVYSTSVNTANIRDFDLPEHYISDLVYEISRLAGVNLRDNDIINYTGQEMMTRKQAETL
jgi:hypothetical protein